MDEFVDKLDKVVYVNLKHRVDRNEHMQKVTKVFGSKVQRFEAIEHASGKLGCTRSHIAILKLAIASNWKNVLILEDDIEWNETNKGIANLLKLMSNPFDVIMLGGGYSEFDTDTFKVTKSNSTHGYLVNNHYFSKLLSNFEEGEQMLQTLIHMDVSTYAYGIDVYWMRCMQADNWFIVLPNILYQIDDYSDVDGIPKVFNQNTTIFLLSETMDIKKALWGGEIRISDVTNKARQLAVNTPIRLRCDVFKEDPCPGFGKCLMIEYTNGSIQLTPEGSLFRIISY